MIDQGNSPAVRTWLAMIGPRPSMVGAVIHAAGLSRAEALDDRHPSRPTSRHQPDHAGDFVERGLNTLRTAALSTRRPWRALRGPLNTNEREANEPGRL